MANIIIYDLTTFAVKSYLTSANTPDYQSRTDVLINPTISVLSTVPIQYWKVFGQEVIEMTPTEKAVVDAKIAQATLLAQRTAANQLNFPLVDILIALVERINTRLLLLAQTAISKQEIIDQLKKDKGL